MFQRLAAATVSVLTVSLCFSSPVGAQDSAADSNAPPPTVELSESQLELNGRALELIEADELEQATTLFESSLALGESNLTYLNLGRTRARLGRCSEAVEAYDRVMTAPRVADPSPDVVAEALERYRGELDECGGELIIRCEPETLSVRVDDGELSACPADPIRLDAGTYDVTAVAESGKEKSEQVSLAQGETTQLVLVVTEEQVEVTETSPPQPEPVEPAPEPEPKSAGPVARVGWTVAIAGAAVLAVATVYDLAVVTPAVRDFKESPGSTTDRERVRRSQTVGRILFPVGGALLAGGGAMILLAPTPESPTVGVTWRMEY